MNTLKKWLLIIAIIPLFFVCLGASWIEHDWICIPSKDHYILAHDPLIEIHFLYRDDFIMEAKHQYPNDDPNSFGGFIVEYKMGSKVWYHIYIPREKNWKTGEVYENALGHEIMHVLEWAWHKGQKAKRR